MLKHRYVLTVYLSGLLGIVLGAVFLQTSWWGLCWWTGLFLGLLAWGAFDLRLGYFLPVYYRNPREKHKRIALTFDDGPSVHTQAILDLLQQHRVQATFFCIGKEAEKHPDLVRKIHEQGHLIGNHTYTHSRNTGFLSADKIADEIRKTDRVIHAIIGVKPRLFRPPFGVSNPHIARALQKTTHEVIGWNIRSLDTVITDEQKILKKVISKIKPGSVLLFHDTSLRTVRIVEQLLLFLQENAYQSVSVADLFELEGYANAAAKEPQQRG
ncbi:polysaccharide deacetylase family protein [Flavobacterium sp. JP2137]|uniref:polysaccharide deacetylase family protein n=1 Tax=Flavobacterium sp. JP2137 TaxID=3414510 RepID=UPI003D2FD4A7